MLHAFPGLVPILTVLQLIYVVGLAVWIVLEKRSPAATLAWIFVLVALPYVGFIVFFFLGPRRIVRKRMKHARARGAVAAGSEPRPRDTHNHPPRDERIEELVHLGARTGEPPADVCETVTVFHDAITTYDAIVAAIGEAKHHVHAAYYIFDRRRSGTRIREALIAAAKRGVTVRLLVDDVGSGAINRKFLKPLRDAGVYFAKFNEVTFSRIRSRIDFRNHRKIVVCDGVVGFTGGINIADEYLPEDADPKRARQRRLGPWRDTHVRITGDAVRWLQLVFLDDWHYVTGYVARGGQYFPEPTKKGDELVQILGSGPDRVIEPIQSSYFAAIANAKERVYVTTPYFVPDDAVLTALTTAALRGVDVRVLVPRLSDSWIVTAAARSYYDACLAAGVRVFEYQPTMIHSKTMVVDDYLAAVGTANFDNRSFRLNFEVTALLFGAAHAEAEAKQFAKDLEVSKEIKVAGRARIPIWWRFAEASARLLSPLL